MPIRLKTAAVHPFSISLQYWTAITCLGCQDSRHGPPLITSERVQVRKVALGDLSDVLAAKHADLKVQVGSRG